ncbi:C4-dicarboxylate transporter DcuC [Photobacterium nomapromontoriensis]|uniref:C4-dicarboxylate transporter DcuC n=1 Tax=Photobacterium nomapromontoriensis TaxID=2910237 RepID=UPI003D135A25
MTEILALAVVCLTVFAMVKGYETRLVLITSGLLMGLIAFDPLGGFDAFSTRMTSGSLIQSICSVMGFAFVMKYTKCDLHLVRLLSSKIDRVKLLIIPAGTIITFGINIALPSAAGSAAAAGAAIIPVMIRAGVSPAVAAAAVIGGTFGSMLNPGMAHNPFIGDMAGITPMDVILNHQLPTVIAMLLGAVVLTIIAVVKKEHTGYVIEGEATDIEEVKVNLLWALAPIVPIVILLLGATIIPEIKMGVPQAMLLGVVYTFAVTRANPAEVTKSFFSGMGEAFANVFGIIIAAAVFVFGLKATGLVDAGLGFLTGYPDLAKLLGPAGTSALAILTGSGDAAAFAFNEAITPNAADFGLGIPDMGSATVLAGCFGRAMSPVAGATIVAAAIAGVSPLEAAKRQWPGMLAALAVTVFIML